MQTFCPGGVIRGEPRKRLPGSPPLGKRTGPKVLLQVVRHFGPRTLVDLAVGQHVTDVGRAVVAEHESLHRDCMAPDRELVERGLVWWAPDQRLPGLFDGGSRVAWVEGEVEMDLGLGGLLLLLLQSLLLLFALGQVGLGVVDGLGN